jgi:choline-sulfatase
MRLAPGLPSFARALGRRGFATAAFVGNWTLRDRLSGMAEHFGDYQEVLTRKRWWGLFKGEATAADLTDAALAWLAGPARRPFLLWVHYVDPHAPYRLHPEVAARLGVRPAGETSRSDRYDTEVAFADLHIGRLLAALAAGPARAEDTVVVIAGDHGESLGEHGEWGHGRTLYETALRIPMGIVWPGRVRPQAVAAPASILDLAPTILGLLGLPAPPGFRGFDWAPVVAGQAPAPPQRALWFQAHRGAVLSTREAAAARRRGLLAVGRLAGGRVEIFAPNAQPGRRHELYDLRRDPEERADLGATGAPSPDLRAWLATVARGLAASDRLGAAPPDPESAARLRALGYE